MSLFGKDPCIVIKIKKIIIKERRKPDNKPILVLITIINNQSFIVMTDINLTLGAPKTGAFALVDNKTLLPINSAVFSNQAVGSNTNPGAATFAIDPANPNSPVGTPVAVGSGTVTFTADASYTDPGDGSSKSDSFTVTKNFSVVASADGASLDVVFP